MCDDSDVNRSIGFRSEWVSAMALMSENNQGDEANSGYEFLY